MIHQVILLDGNYNFTILVWKIIMALCAAFIGIVFCQSAFDKISDYKGNRSYLETQFSKTVLRNSVGMLLPLLTLMELASGLLCLSGLVLRFWHISTDIIGFGLLISGITLLCLLFGQRIAKDYAGAASLTGYFLVTVFGLMAFGLGY